MMTEQLAEKIQEIAPGSEHGTAEGHLHLVEGQGRSAQEDRGWRDLVAASDVPDPFSSSPEWQRAWHETNGIHRQVVDAGDGNSRVTLASGFSPAGARSLEPLEAYWMFGTPLLGPSAVQLLDSILQDRFGGLSDERVTKRTVISGIVPGRRLKRQLIAQFKGRFHVYELRNRPLCTASLGGGLDGYLSRRSPAIRRNLGKLSRKAARNAVVFERHSPASCQEARTVFGRMLEVERASWKGQNNDGLLNRTVQHFYRRLFERLAISRNARVIFACVDGRDIGFIFGGIAGSVYRGQQFSFAQDWANASIGNLLQLQQVGWLCEEGKARYDMGPYMEYKRHWTERQVQVESLVFTPVASGVRRRAH